MRGRSGLLLACASWIAVGSCCGLYSHLGEASSQVAHSQLVLGDPSIATCPTSNCPAPPHPPVLSTQFIHGVTTKGAAQAEWLSNLGLLVKSGAPNGQKVTQYLGIMQQAGAGTAWTLNTDLVRNAGPGSSNSFGGFEGSGLSGRPGAVGDQNGSIGYELDFTNWDADSSPGRGPFTVGEYVHAQGSFTSLSALYFDAHMDSGKTSAGWANGIMFNGSKVVSDNTFFDASQSANSLNVAGKHVVGLNTASANEDLHALVLRSGQTVCFDELRSCLRSSGGRLRFTNKQGKETFSLDEKGNLFIAGKVFEEESHN